MIGSASRKASSEAARTSRVSPPIATPMAAKPSAPPTSAASQAGTRAQSSPTNAARPTSISNVTATAHSALSTTFSASSAVREIRPRTSRPNACSSRSSASRPAASRTVTNISDTATATATANASSEVVLPLTIVRLIRTGVPTVARISFETSRLSAASFAKRETRSSSSRRVIPRAASRPRGRCSPARAATRGCRSIRRAAGRRHRRARSRRCSRPPRAAPRRTAPCSRRPAARGSSIDEAALHRVLGVVVDLDRRRLAAAEPQRRAQLLGRVLRDHHRAERVAVADLLDRLLARADADRVDRLEQPPGVARDVEPAAPTLNVLSPSGTRLANATRGLPARPRARARTARR